MGETWSGLSRRHRFLALAGLGGVLFVAAVSVALWAILAAGDGDGYVPGEEMEGLNAVLARGLPEDHPRVTFTDATAAAGIDFRHFPGERTTRIVEDMGSGAAWGDYDGDGWLDLYVVNQAGPVTLGAEEVAASPGRAALYRNRGDGTFEDVAEAAGVAFRGTGMAAAWGDYDADGHPDLLVTSFGGLTLYRNRGDGTFEDVTRAAGMGGWDGFWAGASWADYDVDGHLDVYVTGYVRWEERDHGASLQYDTEQPTSLNPSSFDPERNLLFRNQGDGTFTEVAREAGVANEAGRSLGAAWSDLNEDGWPDLYVANDVSDNALYVNRGDGTFEERSHEALVADYRGAMGIAVGDFDGDADLDLFITHWMAQENALYRNLSRTETSPEPDADLRFIDEADRRGLGQAALDFVGWGTAFFDYDNDGWLDLLVANGSTLQDPADSTRLVAMRDQLFWNGGVERGFFDVSPVAGEHFARALVGRGAAFGDYDNDGDVDVFLVNHGGPGVLLRNDAGGENGWFQVEAEGRAANRSGVGTRLRLVAGGVAQVREVGAQPSYLSQNSPVQHFGLGGVATVDSLVVRWPGGEVQAWTGLPARRRVRLVQGGEPEVVAPSGGGREAVRAFWEVYREATAHRIAGRYREAADGYRRALVLDPVHEDALYYLGNVLVEIGAPGEGRKAWERLVELNPRSARGHASIGVLALCEAGGGEGAAAAAASLGRAEAAEQSLARAEAALRSAADLAREQTGFRLRLAEVALLRGDDPAAREALRAVLGSNPGSAPALFLSGYVAWKEGRQEEAVDGFRRALEARKGPGDALVSGEGDTRPGGAAAGPARACPAMLGAAVEEMGATATARAAYEELAERIRRIRGR